MNERARLWPLAGAAVLIVLAALFMDRYGAIDELGLLNPSYMLAYTGRMTYPVHYFFNEMVVHPPTHYAEIGWLLSAGVPWYYAEALPAIAWHVIAIIVIVRSPLSVATRIGLLAGLCAPILLMHNSVYGLELFGMRPEGELNAAWLAGLVMLESGRRRDWHPGWLGAGAAVVTFACVLHYYAAPAWLAVPGYFVAAFRHRQERHQRTRLLAAALTGTLIVGLPIAALFLIPHWSAMITMVRGASGEGLLTPLREHFAQYDFWREQMRGSSRVADWITGVWPMLAVHIPLIAGALGLLAMRRDTRVLAAAAAPMLLALFVLARHKHAYYFLHELSMLTAGVWGVAAAWFTWLSARLPLHEDRRRLIETGAVWALAVLLVLGGPRSFDVRLSAHARVHEGEVARAAGVDILGPSAVVGGRVGSWYISGARDWVGLEQNAMWVGRDASSIFGHLDAVVETWHMSNTPIGGSGKPLSELYANGMLRLRGFFVANRSNPTMSYVLLTSTPHAPIEGITVLGDETFRVTEQETGRHLVTVAICPIDAMSAVRKMLFVQELLLPREGPFDRYVVTAVRDEGPLPLTCRLVTEWHAVVTPIDREQLLARARPHMRMRFHRTLDELDASR